jgi:hypothetical protein
MTEDAAIAIDQITLQSVYTCTHPGMALDRCMADGAHPTGRTLGSYGPILHPALKTVPLQKGRHGNCEMPPCGHTGVALRGWSHLHRSPTNTPLSSWQVWFRTCAPQRPSRVHAPVRGGARWWHGGVVLYGSEGTKRKKVEHVSTRGTTAAAPAKKSPNLARRSASHSASAAARWHGGAVARRHSPPPLLARGPGHPQ